MIVKVVYSLEYQDSKLYLMRLIKNGRIKVEKKSSSYRGDIAAGINGGRFSSSTDETSPLDGELRPHLCFEYRGGYWGKRYAPEYQKLIQLLISEEFKWSKVKDHLKSFPGLIAQGRKSAKDLAD